LILIILEIAVHLIRNWEPKHNIVVARISDH